MPEVGDTGWRVTDCGDVVAIDNRPATDRAKAVGDPYPQPQNAVIPKQVLKQIVREQLFTKGSNL